MTKWSKKELKKDIYFSIFAILISVAVAFGIPTPTPTAIPIAQPTMKPPISRTKIDAKYLKSITLDKNVITTQTVTRFRFGHDLNGDPAVIEEEFIEEIRTIIPIIRIVLDDQYEVDKKTGAIKLKRK